MTAVSRGGGSPAEHPAGEGARGASQEAVEARWITEEEIRKLIERAKPTERKYILVLHEVYRYASGASWRKEFTIIHGEADVVTLKSEDDGLARHSWYLIVPKTVPVVIREWEHENFGEERYTEYIYVFTAGGWKAIDVTDEVVDSW